MAEQGTDLTEFVVSNLTVAARRVLADRTDFALEAQVAAAWDAVNRRRARELPGLRRPHGAPVAIRFGVTGAYRAPTLLEATHDVDHFECRSAEQTEWLRRHARQASAAGTTRVLVVTPTDSTLVVAYYAWCMASVSLADAPARARKGAGRYPQPVALLARLGVDLAHESRGLGAGLLQDVVARTHALGEEIGCRGLLVHTETIEARSFYLHLVPEFEVSPTDELHVVLLMRDIRRTLG